jgi:hypothetical protein
MRQKEPIGFKPDFQCRSPSQKCNASTMTLNAGEFCRLLG